MGSIRLPAPSAGGGSTQLVGDKSISHRVFMLASIARGTTRISGANEGADVACTIHALQALGVPIRADRGAYVVTGVERFVDPAGAVDCGNSGSTMRLLAGLLAGRVNAVLDGDPSLRRRPMARIAQPLREMGARIDTSGDGTAPIRLHRSETALHGIDYVLPVPSAQLKSAVLFAGARAGGRTSVTSLVSTRDHSERMLEAMGASIQFGGPTVSVTASALSALADYAVPGDLSAAAFFAAAAAALPGFELHMSQVGINPTRDALTDALRAMGVRVRLANTRTQHLERRADMTVVGGTRVRNIRVGGAAVASLIDELPALCALATVGEGAFRVSGARELRVKESDRIATIAGLLRAFGARVDEADDGLTIEGGAALRCPESVGTHGDHRIGMAAAALAAICRCPITIDDADCIATSFPGFEAEWRRVFG